MKGIAHFVSGVAIATFLPPVVHGAANGSVLPVLGGVAALLPDLIDFRFVRYLETYHLEIDPDPDPDPRDVAEQVIDLMCRAHDAGEPRSLMLHTIRLGSDLWRRYTIRFDAERGEVVVRVGPVVDTGKKPVPCSMPDPAEEARVSVNVPFVPTFDPEIEVDIFSGPSLTFEPGRNGLDIRFLDWHRRWSHSLTLAVGLALCAGGISAGLQFLFAGGVTATSLWVGLVVLLGCVAHIVEDQLGTMGSNLLFPLTRQRTPGLGLLRSGEPLPNVLTVWTGVMLILFNLDRFSGESRIDPAWAFLALAVALPAALLGAAYHWRRRRERTAAAPRSSGALVPPA